MKLTKSEKKVLVMLISAEHEKNNYIRNNFLFDNKEYRIAVFSILNKVHEMETEN